MENYITVGSNVAVQSCIQLLLHLLLSCHRWPCKLSEEAAPHGWLDEARPQKRSSRAIKSKEAQESSTLDAKPLDHPWVAEGMALGHQGYLLAVAEGTEPEPEEPAEPAEPLPLPLLHSENDPNIRLSSSNISL